MRSIELVALAVLSGCASNPAPDGWLAPAEAAQTEAYGGWITVWWTKPAGGGQISGELIAVSPDTIFVAVNSGLSSLARSEIQRARLVAYDARGSMVNLWMGLGTASTLSHGVVSVVSLPVWLLAGGALTRSVGQAAQRQAPAAEFEALSPYARFPQGLPDAVDRVTLRPRPPFASSTREP